MGCCQCRFFAIPTPAPRTMPLSPSSKERWDACFFCPFCNCSHFLFLWIFLREESTVSPSSSVFSRKRKCFRSETFVSPSSDDGAPSSFLWCACASFFFRLWLVSTAACAYSRALDGCPRILPMREECSDSPLADSMPETSYSPAMPDSCIPCVLPSVLFSDWDCMGVSGSLFSGSVCKFSSHASYNCFRCPVCVLRCFAFANFCASDTLSPTPFCHPA